MVLICGVEEAGRGPVIGPLVVCGVLIDEKDESKLKEIDKYFTYEMLKHNCVIGKGIKGLDPDLPEEKQLKMWYEKHPPKKPRTKEQLKAFNKARKKRQSVKV